ncbi:hypothetical protein C8J57DRAFT_369786 [Mycena rebaudengoi]|nr:hypothetical protein C8J57DRAFT_369786 [Mycena rebaudengoi]
MLYLLPLVLVLLTAFPTFGVAAPVNAALAAGFATTTTFAALKTGTVILSQRTLLPRDGSTMSPLRYHQDSRHDHLIRLRPCCFAARVVQVPQTAYPPAFDLPPRYTLIPLPSPDPDANVWGDSGGPPLHSPRYDR